MSLLSKQACKTNGERLQHSKNTTTTFFQASNYSARLMLSLFFFSSYEGIDKRMELYTSINGFMCGAGIGSTDAGVEEGLAVQLDQIR